MDHAAGGARAPSAVVADETSPGPPRPVAEYLLVGVNVVLAVAGIWWTGAALRAPSELVVPVGTPSLGGAPMPPPSTPLSHPPRDHRARGAKEEKR